MRRQLQVNDPTFLLTFGGQLQVKGCESSALTQQRINLLWERGKQERAGKYHKCTFGFDVTSSWITAEQSGTTLTVFREKLIELDAKPQNTHKSARLDYFGSQQNILS